MMASKQPLRSAPAAGLGEGQPVNVEKAGWRLHTMLDLTQLITASEAGCGYRTG